MAGYRGRLIWPITAVFRQLDTLATAADPDAGGPLTSGYDAVFDTPIVRDAPTRVSARQEGPEVRVPVQVKAERYDQAVQRAQGTTLTRRMTLIAFYPDLVKRGLVDASGLPTIRRGDRLEALRHIKTDALIFQVENPPGLYVVETRPAGFGLNGHDRNLLLIMLESRDQTP